MRGIQRLRSANAGVVLAAAHAGRRAGGAARRRCSAPSAAGWRSPGVTPWDGRRFAEAWGKEWVETRDVTDRQIIAGPAADPAPARAAPAGHRQGRHRRAVTVRQVERERWSASELAHGVPPGHAVLSLTTVTGRARAAAAGGSAGLRGPRTPGTRVPDGEAESTSRSLRYAAAAKIEEPFIRDGESHVASRPPEGPGPMPPTLASLVHHSALKLTVRAGEDRLDVPVRWAHASELADPVPYMEGGELLLITALKLDAEDPEAMRRYVKRLAEAGVVGLGFAVGVNYEEIPKALVEAAEEEGLPLLEVPAPHPLPRHQQGGVGRHRRRPVPGGDRRIRGAAGTDQAGARATARRGCSPRSPRRSTAGPRCTTPRAPSSPPRPTGPPAGPRGSPPTWSGCGSGPRRQRRWSAAPTTRPGRTALPGHRTPAARRARRRHGRRARYGRAVRRALGDRPADPHHRAVPLPAGRRAADRGRGAAHAARRRARPRAGRRRGPVRRAARRARSG